MTGSWPRARSLSTTCEPMKPDPPVTRTLMTGPPSLYARPVVKGHAGVVARYPVGVGELYVMTHDAVARLVVDASRRAFEPVEDDVLVETRDHPVGQLETAAGVRRVEFAPSHLVLPRDDLGNPLHLQQPERG